MTIARSVSVPGGDRPRRALDLSLGILLAVLAAPIAAAVAGLILLRMGGPVLYRQTRVGRDGKLFTLIKFRTMVNDAVGVAKKMNFADPLSVIDNDPRIPRTGAFLRASSLDELPQLINIIRGDMSFIGPRPTTPDQVEHYTPAQRGRLAIRPGLTGWAQVNGRNAISWPRRIELDLWYIAHRSVALDTKIIVRTALRVVRPSGITGKDGVNPAFPIPAEQPAPARPEHEVSRRG